MLKRSKDKDVDITSLNHILKTGKRLINIGYFMAIIAVILLCTYLLKEWKILGYIGEFIKVISPIFIGFLIAWFFDPMVTWMQKKKIPRLIGCILVYLLMLGVFALIIYLHFHMWIEVKKLISIDFSIVVQGKWSYIKEPHKVRIL